MKKAAVLALIALFSTLGFAQSGDRGKEQERVDSAGTVLDEIMSAPDSGIPDNIIESATCIAVVPSMLKGAFVLGAERGKGVASCRTDKGWSAPAFFIAEGGSVGFQIGGQAIDVVMLVMNENGMRNLLQSKFKLGVNGSVAAGPVGRHADASTDWKMRAEVLTYSRARGVFAGLSLNGVSIRQDQDSTRNFYGHMIPYRSLLTGLTPVPADANPFVEPLRKYAGKGTSTAAVPATDPRDAPASSGASTTPPSTEAAKPSPAAPPSSTAPANPPSTPATPPANPPKR
jgi:SH3 domain-containing YSC84-like protein 1